MSETSKPLQIFLEEYLKQEGLYRVLISQDKSSLPLNKFVISVWLIGNFLISSSLILLYKGIGSWLAIIIIPISSFILLTILGALYLTFRMMKSDEKKLGSEQASFIGGIYIYGYPVIISIILSVFLGVWYILLLFPFLYIILVAILLFAEMNKFSIILVSDMLVSLFKVLPRSLASLVTLVPILLILTLFSAFSEDLWIIVGDLELYKLFGGVGVILLPVILLSFTRINDETTKILGKFPAINEIANIVEDIPYIKNLLKEGYVSREEWENEKNQLIWRDEEKISETLMPLLNKTVKHRFSFYIFLVSLSLLVLFFVYFGILFAVLFDNTIIVNWSGITFELVRLSIRFLGYSWSIAIPNTYFVIARISLLLSVFILATTLVSIFTDETFRKTISGWLISRSRSWLAASSFYQSVVSPNYQIWEFVVDNKKKGLANVSIVVPKRLSDDEVNVACINLAKKLEDYRWLVLITAFEKNSERRYRRGIPGRRWEYLHNKVKDILQFRPIHLEAGEIRYKHFLGQELVDKGDVSKIPATWFGEKAIEQKIGRKIWELDPEQDLILHPYVIINDKFVSVEVQISHRLQKSEQYRHHLQLILDLIRESVPEINNILLTLNFRDTVDILANLNWIGDTSYVTYKDELMDSQKIEKLSRWNLPLKT